MSKKDDKEYRKHIRKISKRSEGYFATGVAVCIQNPSMQALIEKYQHAADDPKLRKGLQKLFGDHSIESIKATYTNGLLDGKIKVKIQIKR